MGIFPWLNPQVNLYIVKREAGWSFPLFLGSASSWAVCFSCAGSSSCGSSVSNSSWNQKSHKTRSHEERRRREEKGFWKTVCGHGEDANTFFISNTKWHGEVPVRLCKYIWKTNSDTFQLFHQLPPFYLHVLCMGTYCRSVLKYKIIYDSEITFQSRLVLFSWKLHFFPLTFFNADF